MTIASSLRVLLVCVVSNEAMAWLTPWGQASLDLPTLYCLWLATSARARTTAATVISLATLRAAFGISSLAVLLLPVAACCLVILLVRHWLNVRDLQFRMLWVGLLWAPLLYLDGVLRGAAHGDALTLVLGVAVACLSALVLFPILDVVQPSQDRHDLWSGRRL